MAETQSTQTPARERPLSPHLQIYRWPLGMAMSILHRMTGAAMAVGTLLVIWMLVAAATGPDAWAVFRDFSTSIWGRLMFFGWSAAFFYHLSNGVRHLIWDTGHLFKVEHANKAGIFILLLTVALTALLWWAVGPWQFGPWQ